MSKGLIDSALFRPIQSGTTYNTLMPKSNCKSTYIGAGDTDFSMNGIKAHIEKYNNQTAKISPKFRRNTVKATCDAIYDFLYNHVQYKADDRDQLLRSPACSWSQRREGIDCKSYSIFSGCILANLGMKFYIRKIKQPSLAPDEFTHVYIIVPEDQKTGKLSAGYYVIDATKHQNTEATFTAKKDIYMSLPHYGLNAPATASQSNDIDGFLRFTTMLRSLGVQKVIVEDLQSHVLTEQRRGNNPTVTITAQHITIDNTVYPFINSYNTPVNLPGNPNHGLNAIKFDLSCIWEGVKTEATNKGEGWLNNILDKLKDFAKCAISGSSATPSTVKKWRKDKMQPFVNNLFGLVVMQSKAVVAAAHNPNQQIQQFHFNAFISQLNAAIKALNVLIAHQTFHKGQSKTRCGKDANQSMVDYIQRIIDHIENAIDAMKISYNISFSTQTFTASSIATLGTGEPANWKGKTVSGTTKVYTFSLKPGHSHSTIVLDPGAISSGGDGSTGGGGSSTGGGGSTGGGSSSGYNGLSALEQSFVDQWLSTGKRTLYNSYYNSNPGYVPSRTLLELLGYSSSSITQIINRGPRSQNLGPTSGTQQAGGGLIMAGLVLGSIYMMSKNKTK